MSLRSSLPLLLLAAAACNAGAAPSSGDADPPSASTPASAAPVPTTSSSVAPPPKPVEYENEALPEADGDEDTLEGQRAAMFRRMRALGGLDDAQVHALEAIFGKAKWAGQGNPAVVKHPLTRAQCMSRRHAAGAKDEKKPLCGSPFMAPLFDPATEKEEQATVCIDRYEFPNLPCDYPVTWVTTKQSQEICKAIGKRLCDAHEWEGACAGALHSPEKEYAFGRERKTMRHSHNQDREIRWSYGATKDHAKCGTSSTKSKSCEKSGWKQCGSNTFPAGSFPECRSPFGVYDQHGNVAEHMTLPLKEKELGSKGGFGEPEMKGSWFVFQKTEAHPDDCRWRSPAWHDNEGKNHYNYHLGFRCCKDVKH